MLCRWEYIHFLWDRDIDQKKKRKRGSWTDEKKGKSSSTRTDNVKSSSFLCFISLRSFCRRYFCRFIIKMDRFRLNLVSNVIKKHLSDVSIEIIRSLTHDFFFTRFSFSFSLNYLNWNFLCRHLYKGVCFISLQSIQCLDITFNFVFFSFFNFNLFKLILLIFSLCFLFAFEAVFGSNV